MGSRRRGPFIVTLLLVLTLPARAVATQDEWVEIRSQHFAVVSDAGEERARRIAGLLEAIRQVFVNALPGVSPQEGPPLEVFAVKDNDGLQALLPQYAERDPRRMPLGVYIPTADKDFIVLLEDADTENPYEVVFHEYFHSLASPVVPWAPAWFHEGIAEFWENTLIKEDIVETGRPSEYNLQILADERWIPLEELLGADRAYTNSLSERRTSVFYAQSWVLVHYILLGDRTGELSGGFTPYLQATMSGQPSVEAFEAAFDDLDDIETQIRRYLQRFRYNALQIEKPQNIDADSYRATVLPADQLSARFGSYFVHRGLHDEGRAALDQALELNPDDALTHEAFGVLHYRTDSHDEAKASFEKAASLNGALFIPRYYLAELEMSSGPDMEGIMRVRSLLERAAQMNPFHAPSLARLSMLYVATEEQIELALTLARRAAALSPMYVYAHLARGVTAQANGLIIEARAALEAAVRLAPGFEAAQAQLEEVKRIQKFPMSGTWAFDSNREWLQIDIDGRALRCRFTNAGFARQTGILAGSAVTWTTTAADGSVTESTDSVSVAGGELRFETELGEFMLRRIVGLPAACEPIIKDTVR